MRKQSMIVWSQKTITIAMILKLLSNQNEKHFWNLCRSFTKNYSFLMDFDNDRTQEEPHLDPMVQMDVTSGEESSTVTNTMYSCWENDLSNFIARKVIIPRAIFSGTVILSRILLL
jgi:hypothetical protein